MVSSQRWVLNSGHLEVESVLFNLNTPETVQPFLLKYLFILFAVLGLSCGMGDFQLQREESLAAASGISVPRSEIEPWPSALGARSLSCWTIREVPS